MILPSRMSINASAVLAFAFFWVYAVYAAINFPSVEAQVATTLGLAGIFVALVQCCDGRFARRFSLVVDPAWIGAFVLLTMILVGVGWQQVNSSLTCDQLYHSGMALIHAQRLLGPDILEDHSQLSNQLQPITYKYLLYAANALVLGLAISSFAFIINLRRRLTRVLAAAAVFFVWRWLVDHYVTHGDIHPPLRLLLLSASSMVFGIQELAFRIPGLVGLAIFQCFLIRMLRPRFGLPVAIMTALAFGTCPILWHVGSLVEVSIWSTLCFSGVIVVMIAYEEQNHKPFPYFPLYCLLSIASLIRQSTFIAFVPLIAFHVYDTIKSKPPVTQLLGKLIKDAWPVCIMVPWTLYMAHTGTPVTDHSGRPLLDRWGDALTNLAALKFLFNHLRLPWSGIFLCGLLPFWRRSTLFTLSLLALILGLFYSIAPTVWGQGRYQSEIGVPTALLGLYHLLTILKSSLKRMPANWFQALAITLLGSALVYNAWTFLSIHEIVGTVDDTSFVRRSQDGSIPTLAEMPLAYSDALKTAKSLGLTSGLFIDGVSYGVMPEILAGFNFESVRADAALPIAWGGASAEAIDGFPAIRVALLADWSFERNQRAATYLQQKGWTLVGAFPHDQAKDNVILLLRR